MNKNIHQLLKDSGYLDSPTNRFLWKDATPNLRNHLRHWLILTLSFVTPFCVILGSLTQLNGRDRFLVMLIYGVLGMSFSLFVDLIMGFLVTRKKLEPFWENARMLNFLSLPIGIFVLIVSSTLLWHTIKMKPVMVQSILFTLLAFSSYISGKCCHYLLISRLYWHGIVPPRLHHYPMITSIALAAVIFFQVAFYSTSTIPEQTFTAKPPTLMLGFDLPETMIDAYESLFPQWHRQDITVEESDITSFWTDLGTGTSKEKHKSSLVVFQSYFFNGTLNPRDKIQQLPLFLLMKLGLTTEVPQANRTRKYFWEILDYYQLQTYSFAYWHSYPASSRHGGVMSERWSPDHQQVPYITGLKYASGSQSLPLWGPKHLAPTIHRENQSWSQLQKMASGNGFDFSTAYFPLGDQFESLPFNEQTVHQMELLAFRKHQLENLFQYLPNDTRILIVLTTGKPKDSKIEVSFISNWFNEIALPLENHRQLAPTILNDYGITADRLMEESRLKDPNPSLSERVDYGEPEYNQVPIDASASKYLEELKSLGYVE